MNTKDSRMIPEGPTFWLVLSAAETGDNNNDITDITVPVLEAGYRLHTTFAGLQPTLPNRANSLTVMGLIVDSLDAAIAITKQARSDYFDRPIPIVWLLNHADLDQAIIGLETGADACLIRPVDPRLLSAQLKALTRTRDRFARLANRDVELGHVSDRLQKVIQQNEHEQDLANRLELLYRPVAMSQLAIFEHRPQGRATWAVDWHDNRLSVVDIGGVSVLNSQLLARSICHRMMRTPLDLSTAMSQVNQILIGGVLPDAAIVSALMFERREKQGHFAIAGMQPPWVEAIQPKTERLASDLTCDPFLGVVSIQYRLLQGPCEPGDRWIFLAGSAAGELRRLLPPVAEIHRSAHGNAYAELIGRDLIERHGRLDSLLVVVYEEPI